MGPWGGGKLRAEGVSIGMRASRGRAPGRVHRPPLPTTTGGGSRGGRHGADLWAVEDPPGMR